MAEVFKAKSHGVEGFEKVLVLKRILPELATNPQFVEMFLQEARLSVTLSHANIVQVFDLGREDDTYFIAMEYVPGMDLARVIRHHRKRAKPTPIALCVYIACEVARGLDYAHRRKDAHGQPLGIVHRDISPQNVLLSFEGEVKIADFGIARARNSVEHSGAVRGKYAYMAPEQVAGGTFTAASDQFAFGVTAHEMFLGRRPYEGATPLVTMEKIRECTAPDLSALDVDVASLVGRCLQRDPRQRFKDAESLRATIATARRTREPVSATDVARWVT